MELCSLISSLAGFITTLTLLEDELIRVGQDWNKPQPVSQDLVVHDRGVLVDDCLVDGHRGDLLSWVYLRYDYPSQGVGKGRVNAVDFDLHVVLVDAPDVEGQLLLELRGVEAVVNSHGRKTSCILDVVMLDKIEVHSADRLW